MTTMSEAAISSSVERPDRVDEKGLKIDDITPTEETDTDIENGHMKELEVDVQKILGEEGIEDIDGDDSPYPEGISSLDIS